MRGGRRRWLFTRFPFALVYGSFQTIPCTCLPSRTTGASRETGDRAADLCTSRSLRLQPNVRCCRLGGY